MEDIIIGAKILKGTDENFELESYNIGEVLLNTLNSDPGHIAQIDADTGRCTTFADMKDRSVRCALWLRQRGIGRGDIISICTHNDEDTYIPMLATYYLGATFNAWEENVGIKTAQHLANLIQPKFIFASAETASMVSQAMELENVDAKIIVFGQKSSFPTLEDIMRCQSDDDVRTFVPRDVNPDDLAVLLFTSGSTGYSKGVMHNYRNTFVNVLQMGWADLQGLTALCFSSVYWVSGFTYILQAILKKAVRVLHRKFDPDTAGRIIEKYKVTWFFGSPSSITPLCKSNVAKKYDLSSLKYVGVGGASAHPIILQKFKDMLPNVSVVQLYGLSELGRALSGQTPYTKNNESSGFVTPNVQMKFVDPETGKLLGPDQRGEIFAKTPWSMLGYYKNPEETKAIMVQDGWLRTGDVGYYDKDGEIYIVDRIKDVMRFRCHQITPTEIEELLLSHPDVLEVGVVSIPHDTDGDWPIAFVKKAPESEVSENDLVNMSLLLGEYKKLRGGVKFLQELPKNGAGKLLRPKLREMARVLGQNGENDNTDCDRSVRNIM